MELQPFIVAKTAQTLDGKIATHSGQSKWITSEQTRTFARKQRDTFDAIVVGSTTVLKDNPGLNGFKKKIKKVVLDSSLKISTDAKLFKGMRPSDCIIVTTRKAAKNKLAKLRGAGVTLLQDVRSSTVNLKWLVRQLSRLKIRKILVEGGAHVVGSFLKNGLVDQMHIYIAPKIMGDPAALSSVVGFRVGNIKRLVQLKNLKIKRINKDIFIQGDVLRNR